jgi:hypothetical protein
LVFGDDLPNFDQRNIFGRMAPPLNSALKILGEFGGGLVSGTDISSRAFGSSRGLSANNSFNSNNRLLSNSRGCLLSDFGGSI